VPILHNIYGLYYIFAALIAYPVVRILRRAGFEPVYATLLAVPMVGLTCCCAVMAFSPWPAKQGGK
jgi:hypothetical protein